MGFLGARPRVCLIIAVDGPGWWAQPSLWHFVDYGELGYVAGKADYFAGWADFTLPGPGHYWIFLQGLSWLPPYLPTPWVIPAIVLGP